MVERVMADEHADVDLKNISREGDDFQFVNRREGENNEDISTDSGELKLSQPDESNVRYASSIKSSNKPPVRGSKPVPNYELTKSGETVPEGSVVEDPTEHF